MKIKIITILLLSAITLSCNEPNLKDWSKYRFGVTLYGGRGMDSSYSIIYCDSVKMTSLFSADLWVDGTKIPVMTDKRISVWSNDK
jgi:hypothetical protein